MVTLLILVATIALADSINPSTVVPGAVLAAQSRRELAGFILGVFGVSFLAGAAVILGFGQVLIGHVHAPKGTMRNLFELAAGVVLLAAAGGVWMFRGHVKSAVENVRPRSGSGLVLGATIMAVELPTAVPYFAALAAIIASGRHVTTQLMLVAVYNVLFVAPLLVLTVVIVAAGDHADRVLEAIDTWLRRNVAALLTGILGVAGVALLALGAVGIT